MSTRAGLDELTSSADEFVAKLLTAHDASDAELTSARVVLDGLATMDDVDLDEWTALARGFLDELSTTHALDIATVDGGEPFVTVLPAEKVTLLSLLNRNTRRRLEQFDLGARALKWLRVRIQEPGSPFVVEVQGAVADKLTAELQLAFRTSCADRTGDASLERVAIAIDDDAEHLAGGYRGMDPPPLETGRLVRALTAAPAAPPRLLAAA